MSHFRIAAWVCLALGLNACALFSKGEVPTRRYFSPDLPAGAPAAEPASSSLELRLGRVTAGANLGERIMFRESAHEVGFYDDRSWTEKPEAYLRRGLTRALFEERGLRGVVRGAAPTLDVELISFEEVKAPLHLGRVKIAFSLSDERVVSLQQTLCVDRPVAASSVDAEASAVAKALGEALRDAIDQVSVRVAAEMANAEPAGSRRPVAAGP
ncbi:MAG: ABC-type transport auxiliary lipoprotein family protein [Myxococcaceae bacterium]